MSTETVKSTKLEIYARHMKTKKQLLPGCL